MTERVTTTCELCGTPVRVVSAARETGEIGTNHYRALWRDAEAAGIQAHQWEWLEANAPRDLWANVCTLAGCHLGALEVEQRQRLTIDEQTAEIDRLETINASLREALSDARALIAMIAERDPVWRLPGQTQMHLIDAALVAEGRNA